jgi:4-deoxy-L-threo-5-hexosulose-uronate ketol-isomerase
MQYFPSPTGSRELSTRELRETFLLTGLFVPGEISLRITDLDRAVVGGATPTSAALDLPNPEALRAKFFAERREIGVLNIGGAGSVTVDGQKFEMAARDALYIGRGSKSVSFASASHDKPAR